MPDMLEKSMDPFRKLLLIRCWCPDRIAVQAKKYIANSLGERYAEGVILDMKVKKSLSQWVCCWISCTSVFC